MTGSDSVACCCPIHFVVPQLCVSHPCVFAFYSLPVRGYFNYHASCFETFICFKTDSYAVSSVTFSRLEPGGKLVMGFRKASAASASEQVGIPSYLVPSILIVHLHALELR